MASTAFQTARPSARRTDEAGRVSTTAPVQMRAAAQRAPLDPALSVLPTRPQAGIGQWASGASLGFAAHRDTASGEGGSATSASNAHPTARVAVSQARSFATRAPEGHAGRFGLPAPLRAGIEQLSGVAMDDVRVHYGSSRPAEMDALAYAQGSDIHLAPGQEQHLPHEAWHVVQQKQGRVRPTGNVGGLAVNDSAALEQESDVMGACAAALEPASDGGAGRREPAPAAAPAQPHAHGVIQRRMQANTLAIGDPLVDPKMASVTRTMDRMGVKVKPALTLNLRVVNHPNQVTTCPAWTNVNLAGTVITVDLEQWFIKTSSIPDILGMVAHEIGVHTLAEAEMSNAARNAEAGAAANPYNLAVAGQARPLAPLGGANDRRQDDHVNVAKFRAGGRRGLVPLPRMERYIYTMLRIGSSIEAGREHATIPEKRAAQTELFQSFLFDMARLIATDDGAMWAVATGLSDIADVANWMRNYVIDRYQDQHPWLLQLGVPDAGFFSLFGMLAGKALAGLWAQRSAAWNQIKGGVGAAVGWVGNQIGRAAAWVGGLFA